MSDHDRSLFYIMITKPWLGFVEYERDEYTEELPGEEGDCEADGESAAEGGEAGDLIME